MTPKELRELADNTFSKRGSLVTLWQEQAENFYVERADFTFRRHLGDDFAGHLTTSYPLLCRRDLGDQIGQMLRPTQMMWMDMMVKDMRRNDHESRKWLEWATGVQFRAMYDAKAMFDRASKEGDHDFATFGQDVISVRLNRDLNTLMYRCNHLRDMAWIEDEEGNVCPIFRKWKPKVIDLIRTADNSRTFKIDAKIRALKDKEPFTEIECLHMIVPAGMYADNARGMPYFSVYYDCRHDVLMEALPTWNKEYSVERWQTVSGSQYAYSPATVAALPDARLLQAMMYTLLEAGEKVASPPMIATENAVRSDVDIRSNGITWVDYEYDEKTGEALRPFPIRADGMPIGLEMAQDTRSMLAQAFYLNKLRPFLPTQDKEMTAFQAGQIVAQYIRDALPLFAPMETQRNAQICELTFDILLRNGAFGFPGDMPKRLRGADIEFKFSSPLHDAIEAQKAHKFLEMKALVAETASVDKNVVAIPDWSGALRDALNGSRVPAKWLHSEIEVKEMQEAEAEKMQMAQSLQQMQQGADVAKTVSETASNLQPVAA